MAPVERSDLLSGDIEIWRLHYAYTLQAWSERFQARRDEAKAMFDERFCRMWEFYLACSEAGFRSGALMVFQLQLLKSVNTAPLTRDYLYRDLAREGVAPTTPSSPPLHLAKTG
jgi:cyclopropane-fatty-acyl-phospholipid synthase